MDDLVLTRPSSRQMLNCTGIEGIEQLKHALSGGKGVILLTAHFYASRVAKRYLAGIGYPILSVRNRRPQDRLIGRLGRAVLQPRYMAFLHTIIQDEVYVQDPECTLKILRRLRTGGLVNIHFDGAFGARTVERPFLGLPRLLSAGLLDIVRLSGCAVVPMLSIGTSARFRITFDPMIHLIDYGTRDGFIRANLPSFISAIEDHIVQNPEEWELWARL